MSSFGGVSFIPLNDGFSESSPARVSVRAFPGGNNWAISLAGQSPVERSITCLFDDRGLYVSMVLLRGTQQTLSIDEYPWDTVDAVLKKVDLEKILADGSITAKADFVLV